MSDRCHHSANLPFPALAENQSQLGNVVPRSSLKDFVGAQQLAFTSHSLEQAYDLSVLQFPLDLYQIGLAYLVTGVGQPQAKSAVVGEQQQSLGVLVEPPDREQPRQRVRQQIDRPFPAMRVPIGAENAGGLVERNVHLAPDNDRLAIDGHRVAVGIDLAAKNTDGLAVDEDLALLDQLLAPAPRGYARVRKEFLETNHKDMVARPRRTWQAAGADDGETTRTAGYLYDRHPALQ